MVYNIRIKQSIYNCEGCTPTRTSTNSYIFHSGHNMTYEEIYKEYSGL